MSEMAENIRTATAACAMRQSEVTLIKEFITG